MAIHDTHQEGRLGHVEVSMPPLLLHELCRLIPVPGALGFIKNHHALNRCVGVTQRLIPEMVDVLDKT